MMESDFNVRAITSGPQFHFKPYYDMQPWDATGRRFVCMESDFQDRPPDADDRLTVGVVETASGEFVPLTQTRAWNFQQGCMPHWMPSAPDAEVVFNDRVGDAFRSVVVNVETKERRELPIPIEAVSPDGPWAASLNFARRGEWRPGYGYAGLQDPFHGQGEPREDAVNLLNLDTGECRPLVKLGDILALTSDRDARKGSAAWLCHLMFNNDATRLVGLVRWWAPHLADDVYQTVVNVDGAVPERRHCMWVINTDGTGLDIVVGDGLVSHAEWRDPDHIMFWGNPTFDVSPAYILYDVRDMSCEAIGTDFLRQDGHMSYHRDKRWLLTDTYPDEEYMRTLKLYNVDEDREVVLGRFHSSPDLQGELRCDLHPCWNRDGTQIAIDSIHEGGERQVYVVDVGNVEEL
ncbi:MAG: hypothetical protein ABIK85_00290 [Candidatus Eisenbacteria bacterium]